MRVPEGEMLPGKQCGGSTVPLFSTVTPVPSTVLGV